MARIKVSIVIGASPSQVWDDVKDLSSHVEWMDDALGIHFTSSKTSGVGASYNCDTAVGPFHVTDRIEVTEWREGRRIGISHKGVVRGSGRFSIRRTARGRTRFTWEEKLSFPWWMGGPLGALIGRWPLKGLWRRNLNHLRDRVEGRKGHEDPSRPSLLNR